MEKIDILMVSYRFPPFVSMGAIRNGKHAKFLKRKGIKVKVVSCPNQRLKMGVDIEEIKQEDIINIADPLGVRRTSSGETNNRKSTASLLARPMSGLKEVLRVVDYQCLWSVKLYRFLIRFLLKNNVGVVMVSGAPFSSFVAVALACRKLDVPWFADIRDPWSENHNNKGFFYSTVNKILEKKFLKEAKGVITVSQNWAEIYEYKYGIKSVVIENGFDEDDVCVGSVAGKDKFIYYAGQVYPSNMDYQLLLEGVESVWLETGVKLRVNGIGVKEVFKDYLDKDFVDVGGVVPRAEVKKKVAASRGVVLFLWKSTFESGVFSSGVIPGKTFELLASGKPLIVVGDESSSLWQTLSLFPGVYCCSMSKDVEAALAEIGSSDIFYDRSDLLIRYNKKYHADKIARFVGL